MSFIDNVIIQARAIAADNNFRYRYSWEGNGAGAVTVPYTMDCCTFISYAIYLAQGWTWYNQPYSYYWPHITETGFDYFLTETLEATKIAYSSSYTPVAGDIIITDETLHHTFMVTSSSTIIDANNYFGFGADSIAERPWPTYSTSAFAYVYRLPGSAGNLIDQGTIVSQSFGDGVKFVWNTNVSPKTCKVTGTSTAIRFNSIYLHDIVDTPFIAGRTYQLIYHGTNVRFRGYFYDRAGGGGNVISQFNVINNYKFTIPAGTQRLILRLWIASGTTVNETVAPEIYEVIDPGTGTWPVIYPAPSWNRHRRHRHESFY